MSTELMLNALEEQIVEGLVTGNRKQVAAKLDIPTKAIAELLRKKGIKEYLQELKEARREILLNRAIDVVSATLEDKLDMIDEDEDKRLGSATRKDPVDLAQALASLVKTATPEDETVTSPMAKIYQQINILNNEGK